MRGSGRTWRSLPSSLPSRVSCVDLVQSSAPPWTLLLPPPHVGSRLSSGMKDNVARSEDVVAVELDLGGDGMVNGDDEVGTHWLAPIIVLDVDEDVRR